MMVVGSPEQAETALLAGEIPCPHCSTPLRPHGHARHRTVRGLGQERLTVQPRRARCADCGRTQVLLPAALALRRGRHCGGYRDRAGGQGCRQRPPHDRRPAGPASLHGAALVAPGTAEARSLVARTGSEARIPPQPRHAVPPQAVAEPARLEPEYLGRRRTGLQPPGKCRAATLDRDRVLHTR